jgi:hypothetical protein
MEVINLIFDWLFLEIDLSQNLGRLFSKDGYLYVKSFL